MKKKTDMLTSVEGRRVVDVGGDKRRLGLSPHRVVPHPPDAALEGREERHARGHDWLRGPPRALRPAEPNLSVGRGSAALAARVAAVGAQRCTLHRVRRAGRRGHATGREAQAAAVVLLALQHPGRKEEVMGVQPHWTRCGDALSHKALRSAAAFCLTDLY